MSSTKTENEKLENNNITVHFAIVPSRSLETTQKLV